MSKLPLLSGKDGRSTVVPMYTEIDRNLLKKILKEAETGENEFMKNL